MKNLIDIAGKVSSIKKIFLIFVFVLISAFTLQAENHEIIIPEALKPGDTIGLIAPANYKGTSADAEVEYLLSRGFNVVYGRSYDSRWYGFGGTDYIRAKDINDMFANKNIKAIFSISDIEISSFQKPLAEGLKEGYQTYDAMSSIIIGGVISASLFMDNSLDKSQVKRLTIYSGIGSGILLFITYTGFIYAGASQGGYFPAIVERVPLLVAITKHVLGGVGGLLLSIAVGISCFTTAVGIITGGADFFKEITKGDERTYRIFVTILCVYCVIVAPYGVEYIIKIAYPILVLFYPVVIVLVFLHLLPSYLASKTVFKVVSLVTFVTTIPLFLEQLGYHFFEVPFPLHEYGVSWLFPAFWAWITTVLIEKTIVKSKK